MEDHGTKQSWYGHKTTFQYIESFSTHFRFCHQIDDHNNNKHATISIKETLMKNYGIIGYMHFISRRQRQILRSMLLVGSRGESIPTLRFRKNLVFDLINNKYLTSEDSDSVMDEIVHHHAGHQSLDHAHVLKMKLPFKGECKPRTYTVDGGRESSISIRKCA